jgi:hypothetical protein
MMEIAGIDTTTLALSLSALALLVSLSLALSRRGSRPQRAGEGAPKARSSSSEPNDESREEEIVAVIAAAVAAASGMTPGSYRIAGIEASGAQGGFNTPVWGHADRITRTAFKA